MKDIKSNKSASCKFSKKIVIVCIVFVIIYTMIQMYLSYKLSVEVSPTLTTAVYAFFGTELAASAAIRIFDKEIKDMTKQETSETSDSLEG